MTGSGWGNLAEELKVIFKPSQFRAVISPKSTDQSETISFFGLDDDVEGVLAGFLILVNGILRDIDF
jgi:hypothetical protein